MKNKIVSLIFFLVMIFLTANSVSAAVTLTVTAQASGAKDVVLSWNKIDKSSTYAIKRDGTKIDTIAATDAKYTDNNVSEGKHTYIVVALDKDAKTLATSAGVEINKTATGADITGTTTTLADPVRPDISQITRPWSRYQDLPALLGAVVNWLLGFSAGLAVLAIIYSGILYITAGGDTTKADTAKKNLTWAITGLVVLLLVLVIVNYVVTFFK